MTIGDLLLSVLDKILALISLTWTPRDDEGKTPQEDSRSDTHDKDSKRAS
jgi:hypothetical protein